MDSIFPAVKPHTSIAPSPTHKMAVASVAWNGHLKRIRLEPGSIWLELPRSACLAKGDQVVRDHHGLSVLCDDALCHILPIYASPATLSLGRLKLKVLIKEITEADEHTAYQHLADFHYRGHAIHGRTARLIVRTFDHDFPEVLGFIELATPFFMNKARSRVLDTPFQLGNVEWNSWNLQALRQHIHRLVRIARTVVSPEFRGFGIGSLLVQHAAIFARHRWQVAGKMPYFLEISADMLKFVPFVQRAGMHYIGQTDGNLSRVAKDMDYLLARFGDGSEDTRKYEKTSGILDQQVARMQRSLSLMNKGQIDQRDLTRRLTRLSERAVLKDFDLFQGIVSLPKPTFMMGLNRPTQDFLHDRLKALAPSKPTYRPIIKLLPLDAPIRLSDFTITHVTTVRRTIATHAIHQAFDISPDDIRNTVVSNLDLTIHPGNILLIEGPSGSGKTTLIDAISGHRDIAASGTSGNIVWPRNFCPSSLNPIRSRKSMAEFFSSSGIHSGLQFLALAGLSEPFLYLKRFNELSKGQQYRAMLAKLMSSECNVWIADEFCANLDEVTANLVSHNLQKFARQCRATVILASSNPRPFVASLRPDYVVRLSSSPHSTVITGNDYFELPRTRPKKATSPPSITVDSATLSAIRNGFKRAIIYKGRRLARKSLVILTDGQERELARVAQRNPKRFSALTNDDAQFVHSSDLQTLQRQLCLSYPNLNGTSVVTVLELMPICGDLTNRD